MPRIKYKDLRFSADSSAKITLAVSIIAEYRAQGLDLTLRQLYYQFVSRGHIPNNDREYKRLGDVVSNARLAGLIDWEAIVDRTRFVRTLAHWDSPEEIVQACASQFRLDKWGAQPHYVEVWIEKDALIGVIQGVCEENDVPYMACRGYASASEIWRAGHQRLKPKIDDGKQVTILYLGDHDPSGLDMTRDLQERLELFTESSDVHVERLALNMNQVEEHSPPPNPTKMTDSRAGWYLDEYGEECWELDALDPVAIRDLIETAILRVRDDDVWDAVVSGEVESKDDLMAVASVWPDCVKVAKSKVKKKRKRP